MSISVVASPVVSYELEPYAPKIRIGNWTITARPGASVQMIEETMRHLEHARLILEAGGRKCSDKVTPRTSVSMQQHGETAVNVFGYVRVKVGETFHVFSVNRFDEFSHAQDLVNAVWVLAEGLSLGDVSNVNPVVNNTPSQKRQQDTPITTKDAPQDVIEYDYKEKDNYNTMIGQVLSFNVYGVGRVLKVKNDQSGTYEVVEFYGKNGKPIYPLNVFVPQGDDSKSYDWLAHGTDEASVKSLCNQYLKKPGTNITFNGIARIKINKGKDERVYWNMQGVKMVTNPDGVTSETQNEPTTTDNFNYNDASEIPF